MAASLPLSKYHQIYLVLLEQLQEGRFADGLPGELELARNFGVARITVRRALEQLANEKLIVREVGRGTRPAPRLEQASRGRKAPANGASSQLKGLLESIVSVSRKTIVKVIEWRLIAANHELAEALQLAEGDKVRKAVRRRSTSAGPMSHITTWVPQPLVEGVERADLTTKPILELMQQSGVELGRAIQTVSARQADARVAAELQVPVGAALLWVRRLVYDVHDKPVQLLHGLYRPDRYEYHMELSQVGGVDARIVAKEILS
jgi:GntR family transcriptional regulator